MARPKGSKDTDQLRDLYFDWQIYLAHQYIKLERNPSGLEFIDKAEKEKALRYSGPLRYFLNLYGGDLDLVAEALGDCRVGEIRAGIEQFTAVVRPGCGGLCEAV